MRANPQSSNVKNNEDFFVYSAVISSIAAAANASATITIEADASFFATKLTIFTNTTALGAISSSTIVIPLVTMQITDNGSGRNLFNQATAIPCISGDGGLPYIIPIRRMFRANSSILLSFANFSAAQTYRLDVAFSGIKVWS